MGEAEPIMNHQSIHAQANRFAVLLPRQWSMITWVTVALRFAAALGIFIHPLAGMLASFFMDWFDSYLLIQWAGFSREEYHALDKNLDQVWSIVMLVAGFATPYWLLLSILYLYRLLGHVVYLKTCDTRIFLLFPNVFEFAFLWFVAFAPWSTAHFDMWHSLIVLTALKLIQEVILHWIWPARLAVMKRRWRGYSPVLRALGWRRLGI